MKGKSSWMGMLAIASAFSAGMGYPSVYGPPRPTIDFTPKTPPIPKGCKLYEFHGYSTIASSEKAARKKYGKWLKNQQQ